MTVEIIALVEKNYGQKILEEMNSSQGVLQILNAAGRSDDLFDNKQFGTFGEAAIVTIVADDKQKEKIFDKTYFKNYEFFSFIFFRKFSYLFSHKRVDYFFQNFQSFFVRRYNLFYFIFYV